MMSHHLWTLSGLYTAFIFQKPDPDITPPLTTPLLMDSVYNQDEVRILNLNYGQSFCHQIWEFYTALPLIYKRWNLFLSARKVETFYFKRTALTPLLLYYLSFLLFILKVTFVLYTIFSLLPSSVQHFLIFLASQIVSCFCGCCRVHGKQLRRERMIWIAMLKYLRD